MYADLSTVEKNYKVTDFPLNIAVEVTNNCNLNCVMCKNDKIKRPRGYMTMTLYKKIIDEVAKENKATRIWLDFYGEAMLAGWKLYYMIDYAKRQGLSNVCINTNGTLMNKEYADMLLDAGTDYISLDCDGYKKETYESIRVNGDRDVFYKNVEYLLEEKRRRNSEVIVDVKIIEMESNKAEIQSILQYWKERGAWTAVRRCADWIIEEDTKNEMKIDECRVACGHLIGTMAITWDGMVPQCAWDADAINVIGNANEDSIKNIWKKHNEELVSVHMNHKWNELTAVCKNCSDWMYIGEERYDENGNKIQRNYNEKGKIH